MSNLIIRAFGMIIAALLSVVCFFMPSGAHGWESEWNQTVAAAKKEGKVVIIGPTDPVGRNAISGRFIERFGIPVEFMIGRHSEVAMRISMERRAGHYTLDALISGIGVMAPVIYPLKVLEPLRPALVLPDVIDPSKWKGGRLWFMDPEEKYVLRLFMSVSPTIFINTRYLVPERFKSVKDLLDPKWRGKISSRDPTDGSGGSSDAAELYFQLGEEFMRKLYIDQQPIISRDRRQLADWLARGTYPISLGAPLEDVQRLQKEGFPVTAIYNLPDMPGKVSASIGTIAMMNKAPHPNAARVFVNWIVSKEGLEIFARASARPTTRNDIDELSFAPAEIIPRPGVKYFDSSAWDFTVTGKEKARLFMKDLLKR